QGSILLAILTKALNEENRRKIDQDSQVLLIESYKPTNIALKLGDSFILPAYTIYGFQCIENYLFTIGNIVPRLR
ncbi:hypothetical protein K469DRAFT_475198, partial [Zopfia rhizophila CBS 207.26]